KEGKKVWEFFAKEGWTTNNQEINYLNDVSNGNMYIDDQLVVANLTAPRAKAFRHTDIVETFGPLTARVDLRKISTRRKDYSEWTRMKADYLKYLPNNKRSELQGNVELHKKDSSIYAQKVYIDHEIRVADIAEAVRLKRADGTLRSDNMRYFGPEEKIEAVGRVDLNITEAQLKTRIKADQATFYSDMNRDMILTGSLEVAQDKKLAIAPSGIYSQKSQRLILKNGVKAIFEKAKAVLKEESIRKLKSKEANQILKTKTVLTSVELIIFTNTGNAQADGQVFVTQQGREAKAEHALYDDTQETITLTGDVFMKKAQEWVRARQVVVSVKDETFEAVGSVEAEFKL
ncbi:MAG: hypothetical protein KJ732_05260, partial [Candidatus Margulisbacteria bacterium]|nr:hypothetical protein [Candidatus Margulisiibacteriota bacterium]